MKSYFSFRIAILVCIINNAKSSRTFGRVCNFNILSRSIRGCASAFEGITQSQCEKNENCCFDDTLPGVPWCFQNPTSPVRFL